ncbi:MAG: hypothetical protein PSX80_07150 [bacterium]|nr:hypothetical protein [bacterium]
MANVKTDEHGSSQGNVRGVRKKVILLLSLALVGGVSMFIVFGDRLNRHFLSGKSFHTTTATVLKIEPLEGTEDAYVYYHIDGFNQMSEPTKTQLEKYESRRVAEADPRHTLRNKEWASDLSTGSKLRISYRPMESGDIEIATVQKSTEH